MAALVSAGSFRKNSITLAKSASRGVLSPFGVPSCVPFFSPFGEIGLFEAESQGVRKSLAPFPPFSRSEDGLLTSRRSAAGGMCYRPVEATFRMSIARKLPTILNSA